MPTLEEIKQQANKAGGGKGSIVVHGRTLHYKVKKGFSNWEHVHKGTAWDAETGVSASSGKKQSKDGARKHALANLVNDLYNRGLFKPVKVPSKSTDVQSIDIPFGNHGSISLEKTEPQTESILKEKSGATAHEGGINGKYCFK